ncbi:MAG: aminopeptidase N [Rhodospirillaceae bacterium]
MNTNKNPLNVVYLADYLPPAFLIDSIDLTFELDPNLTRVRALSKLRRNLVADERTAPLILNGVNLALKSIQIDGKILDSDKYKVTTDTLIIFEVPEHFELLVETNIKPIENKALEGLYLSNNIFCTQCEAEGFRHITYFLDRPDILACFRVEVRAERKQFPILLSNGNRVSFGELENGQHFASWEDPFPKPSYLFALVAGDLACLTQSYETRSGKIVALNLYVEKGKEGKGQYAINALQRAMAWDEDTYHLEYDLDEFNIVAISDFNMGAMENKSLNIFNDKFILADPNTSTDEDYEWIESIVAHEYFHNWTGNRVTCRDWFQLSLKEGLTVFREQQFAADMQSPDVKRIQNVSMLRANQFIEDEGPLAHPVRPNHYSEINNFYTHTVYEKGAELVRMIHSILGANAFYSGIRLYFERHDGQAVTCEDFVRAMSDASGIKLDQFMEWYEQAGTPVVKANGALDTQSGTYTLNLQQKIRGKVSEQRTTPLSIPLSLGFIHKDLGPLETYLGKKENETHLTHTIMLETKDATFRFKGFPSDICEPQISLNRAFSAPIIVELDRTPEELGAIITHDPDTFVRWDAMQELTIRLLLAQISGCYEDTAQTTYDLVFPLLMSKAKSDPAEIALMLLPPSQEVISDRMDVIDPFLVHKARCWLFRTCVASNRSMLFRLHEDFKVKGAYFPDSEDIGRRALSNTALQFLVHDPSGEGLKQALDHYKVADNMTNRWAALKSLNNFDCEERRTAMSDFHTLYAENPIALDKWFALEAMSSIPGALSRVRNLLKHPKYNPTNPNRIRALLSTFATKNPTSFHNSDGSGYAFLAEKIIEIDSFNPQVAARLTSAFQSWNSYAADRQLLIRYNLERIIEQKGLSSDVTEIVAKSLGKS